MTINFISDLHLDKSRPHINDFFVNYLQNLDRDITDLYILGDLFEYWVGDDDPMDGLSEVRKMISTTGKRINVWYMHGNRDFLISNKICKDLNIHLMIDPYVITQNDIKILLLHGDTLCTDDKAYQDFREMVRSKNWQNEMLSKTLEERLFLADNLRKKSIAAKQEKGEDIMDVNIMKSTKLLKNIVQI